MGRFALDGLTLPSYFCSRSWLMAESILFKSKIPSSKFFKIQNPTEKPIKSSISQLLFFWKPNPDPDKPNLKSDPKNRIQSWKTKASVVRWNKEVDLSNALYNIVPLAKARGIFVFGACPGSYKRNCISFPLSFSAVYRNDSFVRQNGQPWSSKF